MVKILSFLDNYYNAKFEYPKSDDDETEALTETWFLFLGDYDYQLASTALKKLVIDKPTWPPTPGELVKRIQNIITKNNPVHISGPEAWHMVIESIQKHSWTYNPAKVKESLPEPVLKAAQVTGFNIINSGDPEFIRTQFIKTYEQIQQHEKERLMLPESIRQDVEKLERPEVQKLAEGMKGNETNNS